MKDISAYIESRGTIPIRTFLEFPQVLTAGEEEPADVTQNLRFWEKIRDLKEKYDLKIIYFKSLITGTKPDKKIFSDWLQHRNHKQLIFGFGYPEAASEPNSYRIQQRWATPEYEEKFFSLYYGIPHVAYGLGKDYGWGDHQSVAVSLRDNERLLQQREFVRNKRISYGLKRRPNFEFNFDAVVVSNDSDDQEEQQLDPVDLEDDALSPKSPELIPVGGGSPTLSGRPARGIEPSDFKNAPTRAFLVSTGFFFNPKNDFIYGPPTNSIATGIAAAITHIENAPTFAAKKSLLGLLRDLASVGQILAARHLPGSFRAQKIEGTDGARFAVLYDMSADWLFDFGFLDSIGYSDIQKRAAGLFTAAKFLHEAAEFRMESHPSVDWNNPHDPEIVNTEAVAYRAEVAFLKKFPEFLPAFESILAKYSCAPLVSFYRTCLKNDRHSAQTEVVALKRLLRALEYPVDKLNMTMVAELERYIVKNKSSLEELESENNNLRLSGRDSDAPVKKIIADIGPIQKDLIEGLDPKQTVGTILNQRYSAQLVQLPQPTSVINPLHPAVRNIFTWAAAQAWASQHP